MTDAPKPMNRSAAAASDGITYPEPAFGNPVSSLMESGVGNCFPGLEFDLRQLDVRFFPGLVFSFPGVTPAGPDGTQGARLDYVDVEGDPLLEGGTAPWMRALRTRLAGEDGAALGTGTWYLHWVEQYGKRIEMYDFALYQNAAVRTPYEGETCWWIIRLIEADPDPERADLSIALSRRGTDGSPEGPVVVLHGKRRMFLDGEGVIDAAYPAGQLTASLCSPWTHDFRDCACQYWASNHPDVALGEAVGPVFEDGTEVEDPAQALGFLDWMRRRHVPDRDLTAETKIEAARPDRYDPYEINLRWQELDFVLQGQESTGTEMLPMGLGKGYSSVEGVIADLRDDLAPMELALALEYLYAYFSILPPGKVAAATARQWPDLANDLRAARQLILSVALSEMTHLRWVNQLLWMLDQAGMYPPGSCYRPVIVPAERLAMPPARGSDDAAATRPRQLRPATPDVMAEFVFVERPSGQLDTEYAGLVYHLRNAEAGYPAGLYELAVRIDSDGLQHYHKFREAAEILGRYPVKLYLRDLVPAEGAQAAPALRALGATVTALHDGYLAEAADDMAAAEKHLLRARAFMHDLRDTAETLADQGLGVPFFTPWDEGDGGDE